MISDAYKTFFSKLPSTEYTFAEIEGDLPFERDTSIGDEDSSPEVSKTISKFDNELKPVIPRSKKV